MKKGKKGMLLRSSARVASPVLSICFCQSDEYRSKHVSCLVSRTTSSSWVILRWRCACYLGNLSGRLTEECQALPTIAADEEQSSPKNDRSMESSLVVAAIADKKVSPKICRLNSVSSKVFIDQCAKRAEGALHRRVGRVRCCTEAASHRSVPP